MYWSLLVNVNALNIVNKWNLIVKCYHTKHFNIYCVKIYYIEFPQITTVTYFCGVIFTTNNNFSRIVLSKVSVFGYQREQYE